MAARLQALLLAMLLGAASFARAEDKTAELMAAYVYNFARFVEWPAASLPTAQSPIVICASSADTLDGQLLRVHGRLAQGRRVLVQIVDATADLASCHLLYLSRNELPLRAGWLAAIAGKPVLTVSDAPAFADEGGMISLFVEADRVRFGIDRAAAQGAGLHVSARLLALSRNAAGGGR